MFQRSIRHDPRKRQSYMHTISYSHIKLIQIRNPAMPHKNPHILLPRSTLIHLRIQHKITFFSLRNLNNDDIYNVPLFFHLSHSLLQFNEWTTNMRVVFILYILFPKQDSNCTFKNTKLSISFWDILV